MKNILIILLSLFSFHGFSQSIDWINRVMPNEGEHEEANSVILDSEDNVYISYTTKCSPTFCYVNKYTTDGDYLWTINFDADVLLGYSNTSVYIGDLQIDSNDQIYVPISFIGDVSLNGTDTISDADCYYSSLLVKINTDGDIENYIDFGQNCESGESMSIGGIEINEENDVFIFMYTKHDTINIVNNEFWPEGSAQGYRVFLYKLNDQGEILNSKCFEGIDNTNYMISLNGRAVYENDIYLSGHFRENLILGNDTLINNEIYDGILIKLNENLDIEWYQRSESSLLANNSYLYVDDESIYYSVKYRESVSLYGSSFFSETPTNSILVKIDHDNNLEEITEFDDGIFIKHTAKDEDGNTYHTVYFVGEPTLGGETYSSNYSINELNAGNSIIYRVNINNEIDWSLLFKSEGFDVVKDIIIKDKKLYATGFYHGASGGSALTINGEEILPESFWADAYVMKYDIDIEIEESPNTALEEQLSTKFHIHPNPAHDLLNLKTTDLAEKDLIEIFDITGKRVLQDFILDEKQLNISHLPAGVYTVKINGHKKKLVIK